MTDVRDEVIAAAEAARAHTEQYGADTDFRRRWLGFSKESRNYRAQQLRAFGELLDGVTTTLEGWRILDIGCGDGRWLRLLLEYDALPENLIGVDVSDIRFELGRAKNPLIKLQQIDGISLPFPDAHFDLVTQLVCFSNIPTDALRRKVADEARRVVKSGGYIFWWDQIITNAPTDYGVPLHPSAFFDWPLRVAPFGELPAPRECLKPYRGLSRLFTPFVNFFRYPISHYAALIGPKP